MNVRAALLVSVLLFVAAFLTGVGWLAAIGVALLVAGLVAAIFQSHDRVAIRRECPYCREAMRKDATVCPHCRHEVSAVS